MNQTKYCPNGNRAITIVLWVSYTMILMQLGVDMYLPSFPMMVQALHTNATSIQLSLTVFILGFAVSQPFYGAFSDRFGRKPLLLFGLSVCFIASLCLILTYSVPWLLTFRLLQGLGVGAIGVLPRAMLRDSFSGKALEKVSTVQALIWSFIPIIAPVIGGYIQHYLGWRWQFACLGAVMIIALLGSAFVVKETNLHKVERIHVSFILNGYVTAMRARIVVSSIFVMGGASATVLGFLVAAPFIFQGLYHFRPIGYGWLIFLIASGCIIGTVINRVLLQWVSGQTINRIIVIVNMVFAISLFIVALISVKPVLWCVIVLVSLMLVQVTMLYPNAIAAAMQSMKQQIGISLSLIGMSVFLISSVVTFIMAHLSEHSMLPVASVLLVLSCIIMLGNWFARK